MIRNSNREIAAETRRQLELAADRMIRAKTERRNLDRWVVDARRSVAATEIAAETRRQFEAAADQLLRSRLAALDPSCQTAPAVRAREQAAIREAVRMAVDQLVQRAAPRLLGTVHQAALWAMTHKAKATTCPECESEVPADAATCPACGAVMPKQPPAKPDPGASTDPDQGGLHAWAPRRRR